MVDTNDSHTNAAAIVPPPRRTRSVAGGLALLLSLVALMGLGYLWYALSYQAHILGVNVAQRLRSQNQAITALGLTVTDLSRTNTQAQQAIKTLERRVKAVQVGHGDRGRWRIRAAQDLLLIANDQLHFEHNVPLALLALHQAEREIRRQGDPRLLPVRSAIIQEILRLQVVRKQHASTMALELIALARAVPTLPLAVPTTFRVHHPKTLARPKPPFWRRLAHGLWRDFTSLIRIHKQMIRQPALLAPKQAYYLRQNLQLRLYAAELALLEHHIAVMHANLLTAHRWIDRYFDKGAPSVRAVDAKLQDLQTHTAALTWPDISGSLHLLRQLAPQTS